ncbi:MAG TPA: hypothetical protein VIR00_13710, partial [Micromonosporaceae bacterium]
MSVGRTRKDASPAQAARCGRSGADIAPGSRPGPAERRGSKGHPSASGRRRGCIQGSRCSSIAWASATATLGTASTSNLIVVLRDQRTNLAISEGTRLATSKAAAA